MDITSSGANRHQISLCVKGHGLIDIEVSVAVSRLGSICRCSKCASRWSSLRGTRMAHVSWNVIPREQSSRNALVKARADPDCSASGDFPLYLDANRVSQYFRFLYKRRVYIVRIFLDVLYEDVIVQSY